MSDFTKYITTEGERWDTIAHKAFGNAMLMNEIIAANPLVAVYERLPGGIELKIPVVFLADTNDQLLPPWKRATS